jgi:hypothetical protein
VNALLRARIARRCLLMRWRESEFMQPCVVAAAILIVLLVPMVVLVWKAVQ